MCQVGRDSCPNVLSSLWLWIYYPFQRKNWNLRKPSPHKRTRLNLVTSRLCVHDKSSAAFLTACSFVQARRPAPFLGGLFTTKSPREPPFLYSLCSISFLNTVLLVSGWLEIDKECTKFSPQSSKVMGSRHRKSNSWYDDEGKRLSL